MVRLSLGIFAMAMMTLMLQLLLIRVFDVILTPNIGYMIVTCAMFAFGLGGIYMVLRPLAPEKSVETFAGHCALLCGLSALAILPVTNWLPFDYNLLTEDPVIQTLAFLGMYLALLVPFFCSGLVFTAIFSARAQHIQSLYCYDLVGASLGCVIFIPFIADIGPGGLMFCSAAIALVASALFSETRMGQIVKVVAAVVLVAIPYARAPEIYDFLIHLDKRGVRQALQEGRGEFTRWDPISRIDIVREDDADPRILASGSLHIAYDGGSQSSRFFPFDGDVAALRTGIENGSIPVNNHFWFSGVLVSHYLKREQPYSALIIGSAGGQEIKAALTYGAQQVTGVELVGTVIELGKGHYSDFIGNIFTDPKVQVVQGEGRTFLRASSESYDVIQLFSNHTSSSIASGTGAMQTTYLQTMEAYLEYFGRLADDGILHINHHVYPRMITTAAAAWHEMGRDNFQDHVVVFQRQKKALDTLPTLLIKMTPWTAEEIAELTAFFGQWDEGNVLVENPLEPERSFLRPEFYSGTFPEHLVRETQFRMSPTTDDRPFFNYLRTTVAPVQPDAAAFMNSSTAEILNSQLRKFVPMDIVHLIVTTVCAVFFAIVFVLLPMFFSRVGRAAWENKHNVLIYFACLGFGFIVVELTLIQVYMKLVGRPLHTFSVILFTMLISAGLGSLASSKLGIGIARRWAVPFLGIAVTGVALFLSYDALFQAFLSSPLLVRILVAFVTIFPLGFFLGMPFPLGILALERLPQGAVAWAWALNGVFTVFGGVGSVVLGLFLGFKVTLYIALAVYGVAFWNFLRMRRLAA